jgi:hypothetical protein
LLGEEQIAFPREIRIKRFIFDIRPNFGDIEIHEKQFESLDRGRLLKEFLGQLGTKEILTVNATVTAVYDISDGRGDGMSIKAY